MTSEALTIVVLNRWTQKRGQTGSGLNGEIIDHKEDFAGMRRW